MLHIIGLHHNVQAKLPDADLNEGQQAFAQCLQAWSNPKMCKPFVIAEEHSEEVLKQLGRVSIAKEIAQRGHGSTTDFVILPQKERSPHRVQKEQRY